MQAVVIKNFSFILLDFRRATFLPNVPRLFFFWGGLESIDFFDTRSEQYDGKKKIPDFIYLFFINVKLNFLFSFSLQKTQTFPFNYKVVS